MRLFTTLCLSLSTLVLASCSSAPGGVTKTSADSFATALLERLKKMGPAVEVTNEKGGEGSYFWRDLSYSIPADKIVAGRLGEYVREILPGWLEYQNAAQKNVRGTGPKVMLNCGNADSHVVVDVIARPVESVIYIDVLIRGIE